jgi:hypothetical protein
LVKFRIEYAEVKLTLPRKVYDEFEQKVVPHFSDFNLAVEYALQQIIKQYESKPDEKQKER